MAAKSLILTAEASEEKDSSRAKTMKVAVIGLHIILMVFPPVVSGQWSVVSGQWSVVIRY
jgi:hypothetical protein